MKNLAGSMPTGAHLSSSVNIPAAAGTAITD
jgi:hypothetical protein